MSKQIKTVEHGGIMRVINRKDVGNIISSINMTLKDYGIRFELDDKENLKCVSDGVPEMLSQAQQEAVSAERARLAEQVEGMRLKTHETEALRRQLYGYNQALDDVLELLKKDL